MTSRRHALWCSLRTAGALLAACGGGSDSAPTATHAVPASALASPAAFSRYVAARTADERARPFDVTGLEPPTSETALPIDLR